MDFEKIIYTVEDGIATITMNSPKSLNAMTDPLIEELYQAFTAAEKDDAVRVIILTGAGKAFCAGGDLTTFKTGLEEDSIDLPAMMKNSSRLPVAMKSGTKPIIGKVRGAAAGAGASLAVCCDFCFASENAKFIEAFAGVGLIPDTGGLFALSRAIGENRALQLCITGEPVDAKKAEQFGIFYRVCPDEELDEKVAKFAAKLAKGPSSVYRAIKQIEWDTNWKDYGAYLEQEMKRQAECGESPNFKEGVYAFLEKRPAKFV